MFVDYTDEQRALRDELRVYMAELMTEEARREMIEEEAGGTHYRRIMKKLGQDGWLGLGWPIEVGGRGMSPIAEFIFFDEVQRTGFPIPLLTLNTVGPTLIHFGSDAQKSEFIPKILAGELHFSIGYTEPSAGTDLGSLTTRAVREGDEYVINGGKIWNSYGHMAEYMWLAARTDAEAPKHKGISVIIVPMDATGVSVTPMVALGDNQVSAVYFDNVRVPVSNLVGPENGGWRLITTQLNHERVALMSVGPLKRLAEETREWAATTQHGQGVVLDVPWVRTHLAQVEAGLEVLTLLNWKQAWRLGQDNLKQADASTIKVFGSEFYLEGARLLFEILGSAGTLKEGPGSALRGDLERFWRSVMVLTFGGGTNEIQRDIISMAGMGFPRARR